MVLSDKNNTLVLFILIVGLIILTVSNICKTENFVEKLSNVENNVTPKIDLNRCSKQCCAQTQWFLPPELRINDMSQEEASKYIPNNFSCNLGNGSGCLCMTSDNFNALAGRGKNSTSNTCQKA